MKVFRKYYMLFLLILTLTVMGVYGTYAMFTHDINVDAVNLQASNIPVDQEIMEYEKITISANDSKTIALNVSNSTSQTLHYGAWYQMITPSTINDNITIAKLTDSPDETSGTIDGNSNKNVYIYIGNNSSSAITLYVGIKYSETSSLGLPDNRTLITNTRDGKYVVGVTVTNGTVENGKTITNLITNGSFENGSNGWSTSRTSVNNLLASTVSTDKYVTGTHSLYTNDNATNTSFWQYQSFNTTIGDHIYVNLKSNITSGEFRVGIDNDVQGNTYEIRNDNIPHSNEFVIFSETYNSTVGTSYLQIGSSLASTTTEGYVDDIMIINLTDSYGSNIPSQEILDRSISYFDGNASYNYVKLNKGNSTTFKVAPATNSSYYRGVTCTNSDASYNSSTDTLTISNITGDVQCKVEFLLRRSSSEMLEYLGLTANTGTPDFSQVATTDEGIYSAQDDYGTSYYFRGAVENNYVKFAGFYWRIIRINGDGSIRMIFDGTSAHANGESSSDRQIGTSAFNASSDSNSYIGFMYGKPSATTYNNTHTNTNNSTIKTVLENWYITNIINKNYNDKVASIVLCNDKGLYSGTGIGDAWNITYYDAYGRLDISKTPHIYCWGSFGLFSNGEGNLQYPVGLITADEVAMAGGVFEISNSSYYLYTGYWYWTMTPYGFYSNSPGYIDAYEFYVGSSLDEAKVDYTDGGVRPVIALDSGVTLTGSGTRTDPWVVQ